MMRIQYGEVNATAKAAFDATLTNCLALSNAYNLIQSNVVFPHYANVCDPYSALLDGDSEPIPSNTSGVNMGVWGDGLADENGDLTTLPIVTMQSDGSHSADGLTLLFDDEDMIYPTLVSVKWYRGAELLAEGDYEPQSAEFAIVQKVEGYDKIVITPKKMNMPYGRFKMRGLDHGFCVEISGDNINNLQIHQEINPISSTLPISTCNATIFSQKTADYVFEARQKLVVYDNDTVVGVFFVRDAEQKSRWQWSVSAQDYIGLLDEIPTAGVMADTAQSAAGLISFIMMPAFTSNGNQIPFTVDASLGTKMLTGFCEAQTTCRDALQQILFAAGAVATTAYRDGIYIAPLDSAVKSIISIDDIMSQSFEVTAEVSGLELTAHKYILANTTKRIYTQSSDETSGGYITINFAEPFANVQVGEGTLSVATKTQAIAAFGYGGYLTGTPYDHQTMTKSVANTTAKNAKSNPSTIRKAVFVSPGNIDEVLQRSAAYLFKTKKVTSSIIEDASNPIRVGETHTVESEYRGTFTGVVISQDFNMYGGKIVKKTVMK